MYFIVFSVYGLGKEGTSENKKTNGTRTMLTPAHLPLWKEEEEYCRQCNVIYSAALGRQWDVGSIFSETLSDVTLWRWISLVLHKVWWQPLICSRMDTELLIHTQGEQWNEHWVTHTHTQRTVEWTLSYSYTHRENSGRVTRKHNHRENSGTWTLWHIHTHTQGKHWPSYT